jgi:hypothetical protein
VPASYGLRHAKSARLCPSSPVACMSQPYRLSHIVSAISGTYRRPEPRHYRHCRAERTSARSVATAWTFELWFRQPDLSPGFLWPGLFVFGGHCSETKRSAERSMVANAVTNAMAPATIRSAGATLINRNRDDRDAGQIGSDRPHSGYSTSVRHLRSDRGDDSGRSQSLRHRDQHRLPRRMRLSEG